jgi:hypothetical protein
MEKISKQALEPTDPLTRFDAHAPQIDTLLLVADTAEVNLPAIVADGSDAALPLGHCLWTPGVVANGPRYRMSSP